MAHNLQPGFVLMEVCWPQPIRSAGRQWTSTPAWNAPCMPIQPRWKLRLVDGEIGWSLDWREFFRAGLRAWNPSHAGEMRGFEVVFRLRMERSGTLIFWDDDGSVIRIDGRIVHEDRSAHGLARHEVEVSAGDVLEVAQWQLGWDWLWCARIAGGAEEDRTPHSILLNWLPEVAEALCHPNGPPLKMYTSASQPYRAAAGIYSMILNGYAPASVHLFGEGQWSPANRECMAQLLPFAEVVPHWQMLQQVRSYGGPALADLTHRHWFVAKVLTALALPPYEACLMDDDVFILDPVTDALEAFRHCDLVYQSDQDLADGYLRTWGHHIPVRGALTTGRFNAGLFWIRNQPPARTVASAMLRCRIDPPLAFLWEQGLIALLYADYPACELPSQRYVFPMIDGLPGGMEGYDYASNPCGFAAIHFGGLVEKPSDSLTLQLFDLIAERRAHAKVVGDAGSAETAGIDSATIDMTVAP